MGFPLASLIVAEGGRNRSVFELEVDSVDDVSSVEKGFDFSSHTQAPWIKLKFLGHLGSILRGITAMGTTKVQKLATLPWPGGQDGS